MATRAYPVEAVPMIAGIITFAMAGRGELSLPITQVRVSRKNERLPPTPPSAKQQLDEEVLVGGSERDSA